MSDDELNVKEGDEVLVSNLNQERIVKVTRVTKTMIICGTSRFTKFGVLIGGGKWNCTSMSLLTPEKKNEILERDERDRLRRWMTDNIDRMRLEELRAVKDLLFNMRFNMRNIRSES